MHYTHVLKCTRLSPFDHSAISAKEKIDIVYQELDDFFGRDHRPLTNLFENPYYEVWLCRKACNKLSSWTVLMRKSTLIAQYRQHGCHGTFSFASHHVLVFEPSAMKTIETIVPDFLRNYSCLTSFDKKFVTIHIDNLVCQWDVTWSREFFDSKVQQCRQRKQGGQNTHLDPNNWIVLDKPTIGELEDLRKFTPYVSIGSHSFGVTLNSSGTRIIDNY